MRQYLDLLRKIVDTGTDVATGAYLPSAGRQPHARRLHAEQLVFDMADGFPAVTTKPLWWRAVCAEWIWFMRGDGNIQYLRDQKVDSIWSSWVKKNPDGTENGDLGPVYGRQFRRMQGVKWPETLPTIEQLYRQGDMLRTADETGAMVYLDGGVYRVIDEGSGSVECVHGSVVETDQIAQARDDIRAVVANPYDRARRRIIVSLWNPAQVPAMSLPPCHTFHFYDMVPSSMAAVDESVHGNRGEAYAGLDPRWILNLHLVARSIDAFKGLPFNIASYALMLHAMASVTGTKPGTLTITFNDVHIYDNQFDGVREQLTREPKSPPEFCFHVPCGGGGFFPDVCKDLAIEEAHRLDPSMFVLKGYEHHPKLSCESEVAV